MNTAIKLGGSNVELIGFDESRERRGGSGFLNRKSLAAK